MEKKLMLRLSPNEVESVIKTETNKWRIFRIQQVRQQAREQAHNIRKAVKEEEHKQKEIIKHRLEENWLANHKETVKQLKEEYDRCLSTVGQAHQMAAIQNDAEAVAREQKKEKNALAKQRGRDAMKSIENNKVPSVKDCILHRKQDVRNAEKRRAHFVASKPVPKIFTHKKLKPVVPKKVTLHQAGTFTTSAYIPKSILIKKEAVETYQNAKVAACQERKKLKEIKENKLASDKQREMTIARRANEALKREKIKHIYTGVMKELADVDESDLLQDIGPVQEQYNINGRNDISHEAKLEKRVQFMIHENQAAVCENLDSYSDSEFLQSSESISCNEVEDEEISTVTKNDVIASILDYGRDVNVLSGNRDDIHFIETVPAHELIQPPQRQVIKVGSIEGPSEESYEESDNISGSSESESSKENCLISDFRNMDLGDVRRTNNYISNPEKNTLLTGKIIGAEESWEDAENIRGLSESQSNREKSLATGLKNMDLGDVRRRNNYITNPAKNILYSDKIVEADTNIQNNEPAIPDIDFKECKTRLEMLLNKGFPDGSQSTEYMTFSRDDQSDQKDIWQNIDQIRTMREKYRHLIRKTSQEILERKPDLLVTPKNIYYQEIKEEESNKKPVSKRSKFEQQKQLMLKHYLQRLIKIKSLGIDPKVSSSESSAITFATLSPFSESERYSTFDSSSKTSSADKMSSTNSSSMQNTYSSYSPIYSDDSHYRSASKSYLSGVTTTDSRRSTSTSTPQNSSESNINFTHPKSIKQVNRYVDIDYVPVKDSDSQVSKYSCSLSDENSLLPTTNVQHNPSDQQRLKEIYSRLQYLKKLREQLLTQESVENNSRMPQKYDNSSTDMLTTINKPQSSILKSVSSSNEDSYLRSTYSSERSQLSVSTPGSGHANKTIDGKRTPTHDHQHSVYEKDVVYSSENMKTDVKILHEAESSTGSSVPDVSAFFKKMGVTCDTFPTPIDKGSSSSDRLV